MPFYSPATSGFYASITHGDAMPSDAVEITDEQYAALMDGQASGKCIVAGDGGVPVLVDPPAPSEDEAKAAVKAQARALLQATDYTQAADIDGLISNVAAFTAYRTSVREIFKNPTVDPAWPTAPDPVWT